MIQGVLYITKEEALKIIFLSAKEYQDNQENQNLLFLCGSLQNVEYFQTVFPAQNFMHLTGVQATGFTATEFYRACVDRRVSADDISFALNGTTPLKLQVLPQLMKLQKYAKMAGEYLGTGTFLYTEK